MKQVDLWELGDRSQKSEECSGDATSSPIECMGRRPLNVGARLGRARLIGIKSKEM